MKLYDASRAATNPTLRDTLWSQFAQCVAWLSPEERALVNAGIAWTKERLEERARATAE